KANASEIEEYGTNLVYLSSHERLKLAIAGKNNGVWELGDASVDVGEVYARVARVDDHSVVIERKGSDYRAAEKSLKFFFDLKSRKAVKVVAFEPSVSVLSLRQVDNRVCASIAAGETAFVSCGNGEQQDVVAQPGPSGNLIESMQDPLSPSY